jgi:hypothetical protein
MSSKGFRHISENAIGRMALHVFNHFGEGRVDTDFASKGMIADNDQVLLCPR